MKKKVIFIAASFVLIAGCSGPAVQAGDPVGISPPQSIAPAVVDQPSATVAPSQTARPPRASQSSPPASASQSSGSRQPLTAPDRSEFTDETTDPPVEIDLL